MKKYILAATLLSLAILCSALPSNAADMIDNPGYLTWAKFKPGTTVTMKIRNVIPQMTTESEQIYTLKEITPQKAVVGNRIISVIAGKTNEMPLANMVIPAKVEKGKADTSKAGYVPNGKLIGQGQEDITVKTFKLKTKWWKYQVTVGGNVTESTVWICDEVPNMVVKTVNRTSGSAGITMEMVLADMNLIKK